MASLSPLWCYPCYDRISAIPLLRSKTVLFPCCVQARTITVVYQIKRFQQCLLLLRRIKFAIGAFRYRKWISFRNTIVYDKRSIVQTSRAGKTERGDHSRIIGISSPILFSKIISSGSVKSHDRDLYHVVYPMVEATVVSLRFVRLNCA